MDPTALVEAGYAVFPVGPNKKPRLANGFKGASRDPATVRRWWAEWPDSLIGLPTGRINGLAVLDLDRKDGVDGVAELARRGVVAASHVEVVTRSGGLHRFFAWPEGLRCTADKRAGIDVRGEGGYVVAWDEGRALLDDLVGLPPWPEAVLAPREHEPEGTKPRLGLTLEQAQEILALLPESWVDDREDWLRVGMALHHEFEDEGRDLWDEWSSGSGKFDEPGQEKAWNSFGRDGVTMGSLIAATGWERPFDPDVFEDVEDEAEEAAAVADAGVVARSVREAVRRLNPVMGCVLAAGQALFVRDKNGKADLYSRQAMQTWFSNDNLPYETPAGRPTVKCISEIWLSSKLRRSYVGMDFDPRREPSGPGDGTGLHKAYNLWRGWSVKPDAEKSCKRFLKHVRDIICQGDAANYGWLLDYLAHMVQKPYEKPGVAIVLKGARGTGKDLFAHYVGAMCKDHYVTVGQEKHLTGGFNSHMAQVLVLHVEEAIWSGDRKAEQVLKHLITTDELLIEKKGIDPVPIRSCFRMILTSNEEWSVPAGEGERRYFVLGVSNEKARDAAWFDPIWQELEDGGPAGLMAFLLERDITDFNPRRPPETEWLLEEQKHGLRGVAWWWNSVLESGEIPGVFEDSWADEADHGEVYEHYRRSLTEARYRGHAKSRANFAAEMRRFGVVVERRGKGGVERIMCFPSHEKALKIFRNALK